MIRYALLFAASGMGAQAQSLSFPSNAVQTDVQDQATAQIELPVGPWTDGAVATESFEGALSRRAMRIDATGLTTAQVLRSPLEQLRNDGFRVVFECETRACGGFDFRFALDVLPPPNMHVNLADFRYVLAQNNETAVALLASRTAQAAYVQVTQIGAAVAEAAAPEAALRADRPVDADSLADQLDSAGYAVLDGLSFDTGSSRLSAGPFDALQDLADYLETYPQRKVALVGHTDAEGSLDGNIALSKRRAGSVLERLAAEYDVPRRQLDAQGMGYLSPIASNLDADGRTANRRVEVIITSTGN